MPAGREEKSRDKRILRVVENGETLSHRSRVVEGGTYRHHISRGTERTKCRALTVHEFATSYMLAVHEPPANKTRYSYAVAGDG